MDGRKKYFVDRNFALIAAALFTIVVGIVVYARVNRPIKNCSEARLRGIVNIPRGSKFYRESLDRDHDDIACQTK